MILPSRTGLETLGVLGVTHLKIDAWKIFIFFKAPDTPDTPHIAALEISR